MSRQPPDLMFLAGIGRSGTTAMMRVLMAHPEIVMGCERFKFLWPQRIEEITPANFTRERFFDFTDGATNLTPDYDHRWRDQYDAMAAKWDDASYVGDKMTRVRPLPMWEQMPDARFVFIVRDPAEVAASWEVSATNPENPWPVSQGAEDSVRRWNVSMRRVRKAHETRPAQVLVVEHRSFFADPSGAGLQRILDWLDLPATERSSAAFAYATSYYSANLTARETRLAPADVAYVAEHHDAQVWRDLQALAAEPG